MLVSNSSNIVVKLSILLKMELIKIELVPKSPPPNQPPIRNLEKSQFPSLKPQELMKFRKEIEANNVPKVYEMICTNPRYLVSAGDTPSSLREGPRYNALHVAAINKHA
ncbi:CLUMA_CG003045, isoform A [Clunio marinus]|uniref:CLUMA_CG003045, isoform A n=1 Tax=Clunio marinus TaxID=568069 RepID=A0A1J1HS30_9DIPT|nr:CLUMA_CG003045, isoform A [Clunio marinus]